MSNDRCTSGGKKRLLTRCLPHETRFEGPGEKFPGCDGRWSFALKIEPAPTSRHNMRYRSSKAHPRYCGYMKGDSFAADAVWQPVPGRQPVCRTGGCGEPATIGGLCEGHGWWQREPKPSTGMARKQSRPFDLDDLADLPDLRMQAWSDQAACEGMGTGLFYSESPAIVAHAKAICGECPAKQACLAFALEVNERFGVWGGKTEKERARLRNKQRKSAA